MSVNRARLFIYDDATIDGNCESWGSRLAEDGRINNYLQANKCLIYPVVLLSTAPNFFIAHSSN